MSKTTRWCSGEGERELELTRREQVLVYEEDLSEKKWEEEFNEEVRDDTYCGENSE